MLWNAFSDADDKVKFCFEGFHNGSSCEWGWDVDDTGVAASGGLGFGDCVEDWETKMGGAAFFGGDATDHVCAICNGVFCMEGAILACKALADDFGGLVDEYCWVVGSLVVF
jgi:hypothetical protein